MLLIIAVAGLVLLALFAWFFELETRDDRHVIFLVLVFTLFVEALLAGPAADVPIGLLRPRVLRQDFRPPDAVIIAALAARVLSVRSQRISSIAVSWLAFIAVYVTGVVVGLMNGIPSIEVFFQGKGAFYLIGGMVIASGVDLRRLYDSVGSFGIFVAALVPVALLIETINLNISVSTPVQNLNRLGRLSNDSVTLVTLLGVLVILTEATRSDRRLSVGIAGLILLLAPAAGHQRASYLVLGTVLAAFVLLVFGETWRRRATATGTEMTLIFTGLLGLVVLGVFITSSPGVIIDPVQSAFTGEAETRSATARISLIDQAVDKIGANPLIGSGVGTKVVRQAELSNKAVEAAAHNVVLDVAMRVGLIGLALFLGAVFMTFRSGLTVWKSARDNVEAAIAASGVIIVVGVLSKGMVEPALDKFRLSLSMGIGVGFVMAAVRYHEDVASAADGRSGAALSDGNEAR